MADRTWLLPPLEGPAGGGCLNCPPKPVTLRMSRPLAVGFGVVVVTKDGETVWAGDDEHVWIRRFEKMAQRAPDHDWRVRFDAPLSSATYQRQSFGLWVLVEKGMGFA